MRSIILVRAGFQAGKSWAMAAMARAFIRDGMGPVLWVTPTQEQARHAKERHDFEDSEIGLAWLTNFSMIEDGPHPATARLIVCDDWDHCSIEGRMRFMALMDKRQPLVPTQMVFIVTST